MSSTCLQLGHSSPELRLSKTKRRIADLSLLLPSERRQILLEWNKTDSAYPNDCLHIQIERQVEKTPEAVAVEFQDQKLNYAQLNGRANQLARYLVSLGIGLDMCVGICMERSLDMVVTLLAILKAGAAYLPLDPSHPRERLAYVLKHSGAQKVITQASLAEMLPADIASCICLDQEWPHIAGYEAHNLKSRSVPENVMYVLYTSGSTGTPKGVAVPHSALSNHMHWMKQTFRMDASVRVLQKTPFAFDASVWEFYAPLLNGGALVMARPGGHQDSAYLVKKVQEAAITMLQVVPSMLSLLVGEPEFSQCCSLHWLFSGGEPLTDELAREVNEKLSAPLVNLYGPTEAAIDTTYWTSHTSWSAKVSLGRAISNAKVYVLDRAGQLVPTEVPGELYIGGAGLARGYLSLPELTAQRFLPDPFSGAIGARLYRTGDQVQWRPDGSLEFLGRLDHQVKLGGYRIELGEIESILQQHPAVERAAVVVREDVGERRLVGYLVKKPGIENLNVNEVRDHLKQRVPEYMIPSVLLVLESMPLTNSGKLDRKKLPVPSAGAQGCPYVAPSNEIEERLCEIWSKVLGVKTIGVNDNFFELGGQSILAMQIIRRINQAFKLDLPMRSIFQESTVSGLAMLVEETLLEKLEAPGTATSAAP